MAEDSPFRRNKQQPSFARSPRETQEGKIPRFQPASSSNEDPNINNDETTPTSASSTSWEAVMSRQRTKSYGRGRAPPSPTLGTNGPGKFAPPMRLSSPSFSPSKRRFSPLTPASLPPLPVLRSTSNQSSGSSSAASLGDIVRSPSASALLSARRTSYRFSSPPRRTDSGISDPDSDDGGEGWRGRTGPLREVEFDLDIQEQSSPIKRKPSIPEEFPGGTVFRKSSPNLTPDTAPIVGRDLFDLKLETVEVDILPEGLNAPHFHRGAANSEGIPLTGLRSQVENRLRTMFNPTVLRCRLDPDSQEHFDRWISFKKLMNYGPGNQKKPQPKNAGFRWLSLSLTAKMPTIPETRAVQRDLPATVAGNTFGKMRPTAPARLLKRLLEGESSESNPTTPENSDTSSEVPTPCASFSSESPANSPKSSSASSEPVRSNSPMSRSSCRWDDSSDESDDD